MKSKNQAKSDNHMERIMKLRNFSYDTSDCWFGITKDINSVMEEQKLHNNRKIIKNRDRQYINAYKISPVLMS